MRGQSAKSPRIEAGGGLFHLCVAGAVIGFDVSFQGFRRSGIAADNFSGNPGQQWGEEPERALWR
jgi:hypothetical protein